MPPRKNAARRFQKPSVPTRRSTRRSVARGEDDVPDVYKDMLREAYQENPDDFAPSPRPVKRPKVELEPEVSRTPEPEASGFQQALRTRSPSTRAASSPRPSKQWKGEPRPSPPPDPEPRQSIAALDGSRRSLQPTSATLRSISPSSCVAAPAPPQTIIANDVSDSEDSDLEFEDVEIDRSGSTESESSPGPSAPRALQLDLSAPIPSRSKAIPRRKPATKAERAFRLEVHKAHLLCLLASVAYRNKWCDNETVQKMLKPLVSKQLVSKLHKAGTQAQRKWAFDHAVDEVCAIWRGTWKITARGQRRAYWRGGEIDMEKELEEFDDPVDFKDFTTAAKDCKGSRDLGAQMFCALLRSLALEARLVCSLQVLPLSGETAPKRKDDEVEMILAGEQDFGTGRRKQKAKAFKDSPYPVWWVEVFSPSITQWIPLDPIVRNTINKPRAFEPPASDPLNAMSYVIAFEEDSTAKDVTRRYANHFNARTRKMRVESTKGGTAWWEGVMGHFAKTVPEDRDQIEDAALDRKLATEGMPKNVQDFKDHPVYVLERHLRQNEVIEPRRECGKLTVGSGKNQRVESVYRAQDVHACRSADGWYRRGRDVMAGEQPLKRVMPKGRRAMSVPPEEEGNEVEDEGVALYAEFQTELYVPPPIVNGKVPRNGYGNLDVYVKSMIPAGGIHLRHPMAIQAAKVLKVDAAEAVTGFKFKGRQGTAIVDGVVVDERYTAAMVAMITALEEQLEDEINAERSKIMLGVWQKMLQVLKVRKRLQEEYGHQTGRVGSADDDEDDPTYNDEDEGGGFFAGDVSGEATKESKAEEAAVLTSLKERAPIALPPSVVRQQAVVVRSPHKLGNFASGLTQAQAKPEEGPEAGGFLVDGDNHHVHYEDTAGGFLPEGDEQQDSFVLDNDGEGGGFIPDADTGGGFVPDDTLIDKANKTYGSPFRPTTAEKNIQRSLSTSRQEVRDVQESNGNSASKDADESQTKIEPVPISPPGSSFQADVTGQSIHRPILARRASSGDIQQSNGNSLPSTQASNWSKSKTRKARQKEDARSDTDDSMPSRDPDEEDAEPQWLEDAFDDI